MRRNKQRIVQRWHDTLAKQDPPPDVITAKEVLEAVESARAKPLPVDPGRSQKTPTSCSVLPRPRRRARGHALLHPRAGARPQQSLESEIAHLETELESERLAAEETQLELRSTIKVRDEYLFKAHEEIEDLARSRATADQELQSVLESPTYQLTQSLVKILSRIPGARQMARLLLRARRR